MSADLLDLARRPLSRPSLLMEPPKLLALESYRSGGLARTQAAQNSSVPLNPDGSSRDAASAEIQALAKLNLSGQFVTPASALTTWEERNSQDQNCRDLQTQWD